MLYMGVPFDLKTPTARDPQGIFVSVVRGGGVGGEGVVRKQVGLWEY